MGHEVTVCPDGPTALKTLEKGNFDAAILDLRMPGMSGIELLEQLKAVSPHTEAVVMTGASHAAFNRSDSIVARHCAASKSRSMESIPPCHRTAIPGRSSAPT